MTDRGIIVQWNIRGLRSNIEDLKELCVKHKNSIYALQETLLNTERHDNQGFKYGAYSCFRNDE